MIRFLIESVHALSLPHLFPCLLEQAVFLKQPNEPLLGILFLFRLLLELGQQRVGLDFQQSGRNIQEVARLLHVNRVQLLHKFEILIGHFRDEDLLDVDLGLLNQVQQQVERPLKICQLEFVVGFDF